mmetsp:Transcript_3254/g.20242  ORF Transcript_3254/g.20242 Transcript_3254/m.20242 type:complete len:106 (+) Transcript_3254:3059-3376(+)
MLRSSFKIFLLNLNYPTAPVQADITKGKRASKHTASPLKQQEIVNSHPGLCHCYFLLRLTTCQFAMTQSLAFSTIYCIEKSSILVDVSGTHNAANKPESHVNCAA